MFTSHNLVWKSQVLYRVLCKSYLKLTEMDSLQISSSVQNFHSSLEAVASYIFKHLSFQTSLKWFSIENRQRKFNYFKLIISN